MGKVVKTVTGALGIGGKIGKGGDSGLTMSNFDVSKEAKKYEELYAQQRQDAEARSAAVNAPALISQLSQQAQGQGPSLAEAQLKSATNRNLAQQLAAAASMRGRNPAATQRQVLTQQGDAGRQLAEQSAVARLQEQQQAMGQLTQQQQLADAMRQTATGTGFQAALAPKQGFQQYDLARAGIKQENAMADKQMQNQVLGGLIQGGSSALMAMSDEDEKKNISSGAKNVGSFLDTLSAKNYEYKDTSKPGTAKGKRTGVMAQDLEKSSMGKKLVKDTPNGKMVDIEQGLGAVLAAQAELNERMNAFEGKDSEKMADGGRVDYERDRALVADGARQMREGSRNPKYSKAWQNQWKYEAKVGQERSEDIGERQRRMESASRYKPQKKADGGFVEPTSTALSKLMADIESRKGKSAPEPMKFDFKGKTAGKKPDSKGFGSAGGGGKDVSMMAAYGGKIPGQAEVAGDSEQNDKVDVKLSPGEIVIPRSASDSPEAASAFIQQLFAQEMADGGRVKFNNKKDDNMLTDEEIARQILERQQAAEAEKLGAAPVPAAAALPVAAPAAAAPVAAAIKPESIGGGNSPTRTNTNTETGGSSPGGASTGGVGSGIGGAGTGGAATGGASTGGAGTVTLTLSGNSGTGSNSGGGAGKKGKGKDSPTTINISNVGGRTDAGNVASGDGPGALGTGGSGKGSGGGGGGAAPSEPSKIDGSDEDAQQFSRGGKVRSSKKTSALAQQLFEQEMANRRRVKRKGY